MSERVFGSELRVGDVIEVWWAPRRDQILSLAPYHGPIAHVFKSGASTASFAVGPGMTIDHGDLFTLISRISR